MGYGPHYLGSCTRQWVVHGWLPKGGSLVEFGAQSFDCETTTLRIAAAELLAFLGVDERQAAAFAATLARGSYAGDLYKFAGFAYLSLDVNAYPHSAVFDLSCHDVPDHWRGAFDLVNNEGTIEHIANPINGFRAAHDLVRAGGIIRHSMPLSGWPSHGLFNITPKLYVGLAQANDYEILYFCPEINRYAAGSRDFDDLFSVARQHGGDADLRLRRHCELPGGVDWVEMDGWTHIAFRKRADQPFRLPVDHLESDSDGKIAAMLRDNYTRSISQGALGWEHPRATDIPGPIGRSERGAATTARSDVPGAGPPDHMILHAAALILSRLGERNTATVLMQKAIALSPSTPEYALDLQRLIGAGC